MKNTKGLTKKLLAGLFCALVSGSGYASAMPTGAHDLQNISGITQNGNIMDIVGKGNAVAKWQDFSLKQGETVNFKGMQNVLNIVDGNKFSDVRGTINGQGINVFLVNPSGVLFGDTSKVNVGSLTVLTQELSKNLADEFVKNGTIATDTSKLGIGNVTMVGNVNADSIKVIGNNISLVNTGTLNAADVSLTTPGKGFVNVLKGQDVSKLNVAGGTLRDDFEAVDSQDKLANLKSGGHYMMTKDIKVDGTWKGSKADKTEEYFGKTMNSVSDITLNGMGYSVEDLNGNGLFEGNTRTHNINLSNIVFEGNTFEKSKENGSTLLMDDSTGAEIDNVVNNYKSINSNGLLSKIRDGKVNNVINNADNVSGGYVGNMSETTYNTIFTNITNNGKGRTSIAEYMYGGNLINSTNNGDMTQAGFAYYYYNYAPTDDRRDRTYGDVTIRGNVNNGNITTDYPYSSNMAGLISYGMFEEVDNGIPQKSIVTIDNNTNNGRIDGVEMAAGGIISQVYHNVIDKNNKLYITNNTNHGDLRGSYVGGIVGRLSGNNYIVDNSKNYGNIIDTTYVAGGVIGEVNTYSTNTKGKNIISNALNYGKIGNEVAEGDGSYGFGGIIGRFYGGFSKNLDFIVDHIGNYGEVTAGNSSGGVIGTVDAISSLKISNAFNKGNINISRNSNPSPTQWQVGGLIGAMHGENLEVSNSFNAGTIDTFKGTNLSATGGLVGLLDINDGTFKNVFNVGNINNSVFYTGGFIGSTGSNLVSNDGHKITFENAYNTGNILIDDTDPAFSRGGNGLLIGENKEAIEFKNVYNTGVISSKNGQDLGNPLVGAAKEGISTVNVYSTAKNSTVVGTNVDNIPVSMGDVQIANDKKKSNFKGFDVDTNGSRPDATWRIYEGYTNPLLTVFMNGVNLNDTTKTVTYTGREQIFSQNDLASKNDFDVPNFFTMDIDYSKDSHVFDSKDGKGFEKVAGTEVGKYQTKIYSDQLGFNFNTAKHDDTLTLNIEPAPAPEPESSPTPAPAPAPAPTPAPVPEDIPVVPEMSIVNIGANKIIKVNVANQTGSYKAMGYEEHTLLNEKEAARIEPTDEQNIVEVAE